ncbi:uncharacterized protein LOC141674849 [Apium graveolens]|uniref:uncharacterized protein LOC141674849 n=1 Tax=Apium graveolens TaxID=4045 RepID=UPI003D7A8CB3
MVASPSNQARIEQLEKGIEELRTTLGEQVATTVNNATRSLQRKGVEGSGAGRNEGFGYGSGLGSGTGSGRGFGFGSGRFGDPVGGNWKVKKLDLPVFDGMNPDGWILRAERYFHFYRLGEEESLEAAVVSLDGDALLWFQWEDRRRPIRNWTELKSMLLRQFRPSSIGSLQEQWLHHQQQTDVVEYRRRFIELMAPLTGVPEEIALAQFINGLKDEIKTEVRVLGPINLDHAMELAVKVEEKLRCNGNCKASGVSTNPFKSGTWYSTSSKSQSSFPSSSSRSVSVYSQSSSSPSSPSGRSMSNLPVAKPMGEFRRLTEKELQTKREKGECFRCEEKWSTGHRCKKRELSVILMQGEVGETEQGGNDELGEEGLVVLPSEDEEIPPEISLNSVVGITNPKTLKLRGEVLGKDVVVMVDPGATHNFISTNTVKKLGLSVVKTGKFGVSLGNGEMAGGEGECKGVMVHLPTITVVEDFLPLDLGNSDVILGVAWLEKLGTVITNWKTQTLKFMVGGEQVTVQGDPSLGRSLISLKAMLKTLKKEGKGFLVELNELSANKQPEAEEKGKHEVPVFLSTTLQNYETVFEMPPGLPPSRGHEHGITLKEGTYPVGVRPYRYSQAQKNEIEALVRDMLHAGIIQPSNSPFSSPVILVKKKNGSWRFCVDYRALNKVTVADKFPIPVIDELLDELHGAKNFSKLDLQSGYHQIRVKAGDVTKRLSEHMRGITNS